MHWTLLQQTHFLSLKMIFLSNESFLCFERRLVAMDLWSSLFFSQRVWGTQYSACLHFLSLPSCSILYIGMYRSQLLIIEFFYMDCILPILLKYIDFGLMSALVWVHLSMTRCLNETLKTRFELGSQLWHFGHWLYKFS